MLQPDKTSTFSVSAVVKLAKRFPQLCLDSSDDIDSLREEFLDFTLSPTDLPTPQEYKAADGSIKQRAGSFWWEVGKLKTLDGHMRFPRLFKLMAGLLAIPVSNADSERGFSILRKIHTDQRSNLSQATIIALMSLQFNSDECCHDIKFSEELLCTCKKATNIHIAPKNRSSDN